MIIANPFFLFFNSNVISVLFMSCVICRVKALNALGESSWSEYSSMTTLIDTSRIPRVSSLSYHNTSHSVTFQAATYPLYLVAKLEVLLNSSSSSWQLIKTVPVKTAPYEIRLPKNLEFHNLR